MRIISGILKGRQFNSPKKHSTHPMSEKARGAMFNALGDISGLTFFDAYAGTGAIGFEAISRGAKSVVACDIDKSAFRTLQENTKALGILKEYTAVQANCVSYLQNQPQEFDIIICDPPYNEVKTSQLVSLSNYVKPNGLLILSLPPEIGEMDFDEFDLVQSKSYGDANLLYFRRAL